MHGQYTERTKSGEDRSGNVILDHLVDRHFCVFSVFPAELRLRVVRDEIARVHCPGKGCVALAGAGQRTDRLESGKTEIVRRVAEKGAI